MWVEHSQPLQMTDRVWIHQKHRQIGLGELCSKKPILCYAPILARNSIMLNLPNDYARTMLMNNISNHKSTCCQLMEWQALRLLKWTGVALVGNGLQKDSSVQV